MFVSPGEAFDVVELAEQTMTLRERLLELGVDAVRHAGVPAGVAPVDAFAMGSLQVTLTPAALPAVVGLVRAWLVDRPVPSVRLVVDGDLLQVGRATRRQQRRVDDFLRRHILS